MMHYSSEQTQSRRVKIVRVSRELLADVFKQSARRQVIVVQGLPEDAKMVGISEECYCQYDQIALKFESEQWPEVPPGHNLEEIDLQVSAVDLVGVIKDAINGVPCSIRAS